MKHSHSHTVNQPWVLKKQYHKMIVIVISQFYLFIYFLLNRQNWRVYMFEKTVWIEKLWPSYSGGSEYYQIVICQGFKLVQLRVMFVFRDNVLLEYSWPKPWGLSLSTNLLTPKEICYLAKYYFWFLCPSISPSICCYTLRSLILFL